MKKTASLFLFILFFVFLSGCAYGETAPLLIEDVVQEKPCIFSCSFDGVRHEFLLDLPEKSDGAPLVLMLPGYGNTAEAFRTTVHFEEAANPLGYAVVYVTGAPNPNDPTSAIGWHFDAGSEGNRDVAFLVSLAQYLQEAYSLDKTRTYAVGFSNGAFMVHRLAMEAGDSFAACVSVAGRMPESIWKERREENRIGFFQITGEKDDVVPKSSDGSAKYTKDPAIEDVMIYWASSNGLEKQESCRLEDASVLTKYTGDNAASQQVWHLFISGGHHSWPNGQFGHPVANSLILEFFEAQVPAGETPEGAVP
ncbi:MAG: prolyl oligopeptidase family serine peptidase [Oscillospiraceae bacterium]|nr:prolyl oligopeptidase family serine peptidase [Oscillospiraceae bacterium]